MGSQLSKLQPNDTFLFESLGIDFFEALFIANTYTLVRQLVPPYTQFHTPA